MAEPEPEENLTSSPLQTWLTYGILPEHVYPMLEGDFTTTSSFPASAASQLPSENLVYYPILDEDFTAAATSSPFAGTTPPHQPPSENSDDLTNETPSPSSQIYTDTPTPTSPTATSPNTEKKLKARLKDTKNGSGDNKRNTGIHDGADGWTDLKTNRFLRRQFFDYFNENRIQCLQCPPCRERRSVRTNFINFNNYYHTTKPTIPLETYYYGECTGRIIDTADCCSQMLKCPECQEDVAKVDLFRHIVAHFKWKSFSKSLLDRVCKYCLCPVKATSNMDFHVDKKHKVFSDSGHCCRICCKTFEDEAETTLHMWQTHCESEMPYKCPICDYRTSFLHLAVDHCDEAHSHMKRFICPICLKCFPFVGLSDIFNNIKQHVMGHMLKAENIDCNSCALKFVEDLDYIQHRTDEDLHKSMKDCRGFQRYSLTDESPNMLMAPDPNTIKVEHRPCVHMKEVPKKAKIKTEPDEFVASHEQVFARVLEQMNPSPIKDMNPSLPQYPVR